MMKNLVKKCSAAVMATIFSVKMSIMAFATDMDVNWIKEPPADDQTGEVVQLVKNGGQNLYQILIIVGMVIAVCSGILAFIQYMSGDRTKRTEAKDRLLHVAIGALGIGLVVTAIGIIMQMGSKF